jgi:predicted nucleic acid-binding protein
MSGARHLELNKALQQHDQVLLDTCVLIGEYGYQRDHRGQPMLFKEIRATHRATPLVALWEFLHKDKGQMLPLEERQRRRKWLKKHDVRTMSFHRKSSDAFRSILELEQGPEGAVDSLIAAEGLAYGWPVVTYNVKHFQKVKGLLLVGLKQP